MAAATQDFGFVRADVSRVARRQLTLSAALLALVGFATLGATYAVGPAQTAAVAPVKFDRAAPSQASEKLERLVSTARPG